MNFIRRFFSRPSSTPSKPSRPDSPYNKVIKKILFYGFIYFTTATIVSKKYKTNLIFTFEPNQQNKKIIGYNSVFHQGKYNPTYWMFFGPLQRFYAKYFQETPYFRALIQPSSKQQFQTHSLPITDKYSTKENLSVTLIVAGCEGLDVPMQKLMISMNLNGFKTVCVRPDDFHNLQRLQKTIEKVKSQNPNSKIYGIGIDYGANLLVNFAAKNTTILNGIVSIGNPLNLEQSQKNVQNANFLWKNLLYKDMLKGRISACKQNKSLIGQTLKLNPQITSLYEIDRTCYNGSFEDYPGLKERLSSINQVQNLKIPSLFIQSQQDPCSMQIQFQKRSIQSNVQKLQNPNCVFVETQRGGHTQWFQSMKKIRWVSRPIIHFFRLLDGNF